MRLMLRTLVGMSGAFMSANTELRQAFEIHGKSIAEWSREHGFSAQLVYRVLRGGTPALRGQTHKISVALGLKPAPPTNFPEALASSGKSRAEPSNVTD